MKTNPPMPGFDSEVATIRQADEAQLIDLLEKVELKHGFIPHAISDEISRLLEVKLERLHRIQGKLDSTIRRDVQ